MPYPAEHAARVRDPADFVPGERVSKEVSPGIRLILGRLKSAPKGALVAQTYRFAKERFTKAQARAWLKEHDITAIKFSTAENPGPRGDAEVIRYDRGQLLRSHRTEEGYLLAEGYAARTGVLIYQMADGTERRELVRPEELFRPDSLGSLGRKPVTLLHPAVMLTPDTVAEHSVGDVDGEVAEEAGGFVKVKLAVRRRDAIEAVEGGTQELSCGYTCGLDDTPGEWEGQSYDAVQLNRRYNHLAVVPRGRAGHAVRLRADSTDAAMTGVAKADAKQEPEDKIMADRTASVEIGGVRHDGIDPALAQAVAKVNEQLVKARADAEEEAEKATEDATKTRADLQKQIDEITGKRDAIAKQLDELKAELEDAKAKLEEAKKGDKEKTDAFLPRFDERVELLQLADKVGVKPDDAAKLDADALKRAIAQAHDAELKLDSVSDGYLDGYLAQLQAQHKRADASLDTAAGAAAGLPAGDRSTLTGFAKERADAMAEYRKNTFGEGAE